MKLSRPVAAPSATPRGAESRVRAAAAEIERAPARALPGAPPDGGRPSGAAAVALARSAVTACSSWCRRLARRAALLLGGVAMAAWAQQPHGWPPSLAELDALGRAIASEGCARPLEVKSTFVRSAGGADRTDEMRSIDCRGVRLAIYVARAGEAARESPMELVVERAHPRIDPRLGVGADAEAVRALLGPPSARRGEGFAYALRGRDSLGFEVRDGSVRALTWSWDVD